MVGIVPWLLHNCRFALDQQTLLDFDEPGSFTEKPEEIQSPDLQKDFKDFGMQQQEDDFLGGFFHVTTNLPAVLHWGALKSRNQLGAVPGLGGGAANESPSTISLTYNQNKAWQLYEALEFAASVAHGKTSASQILDFVMEQYGIQDIYPDGHVKGVLSNYLPRKILRDEFMEGMEEALDKAIQTPQDRYAFLQEVETACMQDQEETETEEFKYMPAGFTAPFETFSQINPDNIGVLRLEVRKDAVPEHVYGELELRFDPDDVRLAPNPIMAQGNRRMAMLRTEWVGKNCKFAADPDIGPEGTPESRDNWRKLLHNVEEWQKDPVFEIGHESPGISPAKNIRKVRNAIATKINAICSGKYCNK